MEVGMREERCRSGVFGNVGCEGVTRMGGGGATGLVGRGMVRRRKWC